MDGRGEGERVVGVLQGKSSNYDSDLFAPIFAKISSLCGRPYGGTPEAADVAFRVIADWLRCRRALAATTDPVSTTEANASRSNKFIMGRSYAIA
jgi:alanyl-tRNA synthetase